MRPVHKLIEQAHELERGATEAEVLESPVTREVEMLSTSWCLTMTPSISLGEMNLDEEVKREVMVHNCGTRSILLSGAQLQHDDADLEWSIEGLERPRTLQPGQQLPLNVAFILR